jgi:hypothetical protein
MLLNLIDMNFSIGLSIRCYYLFRKHTCYFLNRRIMEIACREYFQVISKWNLTADNCLE